MFDEIGLGGWNINKGYIDVDDDDCDDNIDSDEYGEGDDDKDDDDDADDLYIIGAVCLSQKWLFCPTELSRTF